ncbi:uncharacterized protein M6B38_144885 [Iris pallida]|uniref:Uncharacterized protein n=1 Tax=Iris pallida TaxID=29817 RepID=A0AAX6FAB4_IRIPA|nr:uncharacterized protein M6B38_144885 [Iris pallida]
MNQCAMQQNAFAGCGEEAWGPVPDRKTPVFCPKPRRVGQLSGPDPIRPLRWHASYRADLCDSKVGQELLDIFLVKQGGEMASSPPFFCGSPPTRAANPVVHDARFGYDKPVLAPISMSGNPGSPISPHKTCAPRATFGFKPAEVRVEGFDCLNRDGRRGQSFAAVA